MNTLRQQMIDAMRNIGVKYIGTDTAARIMAILYVHGGYSEKFTHSPAFVQEAEYIQAEYGLYGTGVPTADFTERLQRYVRELEQYVDEHPRNMLGEVIEEIGDKKPSWVNELLKERYGFTI